MEVYIFLYMGSQMDYEKDLSTDVQMEVLIVQPMEIQMVLRMVIQMDNKVIATNEVYIVT